VNLAKKKGRHIPINSGSGGAHSSRISLGSSRISSGSSRISSGPSEDKSVSGPRVVERGKEEGVTTREKPSFGAWERAAKGSLVEMTSGRTREAVSV